MTDIPKDLVNDYNLFVLGLDRNEDGKVNVDDLSKPGTAYLLEWLLANKQLDKDIGDLSEEELKTAFMDQFKKGTA